MAEKVEVKASRKLQLGSLSAMVSSGYFKRDWPGWDGKGNPMLQRIPNEQADWKTTVVRRKNEQDGVTTGRIFITGCVCMSGTYTQSPQKPDTIYL